MGMKMRLKMKNRSQNYDINRPRAKHGPKYPKFKMCFSIMIATCIRQHMYVLYIYNICYICKYTKYIHDAIKANIVKEILLEEQF